MYATVFSPNGKLEFKTKEDYKTYLKNRDKIKLNEKEYAKQHKSEKVHFIFHGHCLDCSTPLRFGIGNCLGCIFYEYHKDKPDLKTT